MPGFLIQQGATVMCVHGGQAMPTVPSPAVSLDGMPARHDRRPVDGRGLRRRAAAGTALRHRPVDRRARRG